MYGRIGQRDACELLDDVAHLRRGGFEKFAAGGCIEEQVSHLDGRSHRAADSSDRLECAAGDGQFVTALGVGRAAPDADLGNRADAGQRLAAKAHCSYGKKVFLGGQLAGGVLAKGQLKVVCVHAGAVVGAADQLDAAVGDIEVDPRRGGVDAVLQQLLHDRGGTFDHLAGGDLVDHQRR